jgi:hypothetical protein
MGSAVLERQAYQAEELYCDPSAKKSPLRSTEREFHQTLFVCPLFRFKAPGKLISAKDVVFIGVFNWKGK